MKNKSKGGKGRIAAIVITLLFKVVATLVVVAIPLLGVWAGSSLAAYANGPIWVTILAGLAAFPLLPLAWDGSAELRRRRRDKQRERILTFWDRLIVRTFVLNLVFLGVFLAAAPGTIFTALSTRGDWMLEGQQGATAQSVRSWLLGAADGFAWLYESTEDNPFAEYADEGDTPTPVVTPTPDDADGTDPEAEDQGLRWPLPADLHPVVRDMPEVHRASIESVAQYIVDQEADPFLRVKALHDFVADHVAYDAPAYEAGVYPPQDAETVFRTGLSVCAGYARLMVALAEAVGITMVYVVGNVRSSDDDVSGSSHAWNAVEIEGGWYLLDATWDSGSVDGPTFDKRYKTDYFLTPPNIFGLDHFPEEVKWQLRSDPISRGEFNRQPKLRPRFYANGMRLVEPDRSQVTVDDSLRVVVENPVGRFMLASYRRKGSTAERTRCDVENGRRVEIECEFPRDAIYEVVLFDSGERYGQYWDVGSIEVIAHP